MNTPELFRRGDRPVEPAPYHYRECGLDNIYLLNGFILEDYDGDQYVSVEDVDSLWKAIGLQLVTKQKTLSPKEIRFLRGQMDLTQAELAMMLRVDDQTVARWEKGRVKLPGPADVALRTAFLASPVAQPEGHKTLKGWFELVGNLVGQDQPVDTRIVFENHAHSWTEREVALCG